MAIRLLGTFAAAAAVVVAAHAVAHRLFAREAPWVRLAATLVGVLVAAEGLFYLLATAHAFRPGPAFLACWALLAAGLVGQRAAVAPRAALAALRADLAAVPAALRSTRGLERVGLLLLVTPVLARVLRGLVAPPLAWDGLTYHLARAALFVQHAGLAHLPGADASPYYDYYPPYGDVLSSWAMLASGDDRLLALAGALVWLVVVGAIAAAARALGASARAALWWGLAIGLMPAVDAFVTSGYVDNLVIALTGLAALFCVLLLRAPRGAPAALLGAALGLLAGTKSSGLVLLLATAVALALLSLRVGALRRPALVTATVAFIVAVPPYARAFVATGNPLFPLGSSLFGHPLLQGDPQLEGWLHAGGTPRAGNILAALFSPLPNPFADCYALGPAALIFPFGMVVALVAWRRARHDLALLVPPALALLSLLPALAGSGLWTIWAAATTRLVAAAAAMLVLPLALRAPLGLARAAATLGALASLPFGLRDAQLTALADARLAWAVLAGGMVVACALRRRALVAGATFVATVVAVILMLGPVRARNRHDIYAALAAGRTWDAHVVARGAVVARLWRAVDDGSPHRIACASGWAYNGQNLLLYPLLGSRLQNEVIYVSPARSGRPLGYGPGRAREAVDFATWYERLRRGRVDTLVLVQAPPVETRWVMARADLFAPLAISADGRSVALRLLAPAAAAPGRR